MIYGRTSQCLAHNKYSINKTITILVSSAVITKYHGWMAEYRMRIFSQSWGLAVQDQGRFWTRLSSWLTDGLLAVCPHVAEIALSPFLVLKKT